MDNSDLSSAEVLSYYLTERSFYDQRTATYQTRVVALCPVLHRDDGFSEQATKYPMFWVNYEDVSPYLSRMGVMASNYNNVSSSSINDFFVANRYKGDIYKTTNLRNRTLAQDHPTDSAMVRAQKQIEGQLEAFERGLWTSKKAEETTDSTAIAATGKKAKTARVERIKEERAEEAEEKAEKKARKASSSSSSGARISVRRERR